MAYAVGMIPYTNMEPFRLMGPPCKAEFVDCLPSESIAALHQNRIVAAAVPVGGLPRLNGKVRFVGRFGIAAPRVSMSVLFFSRTCFRCFKRPMTVELTTESASSVRLLYLLFSTVLDTEQIPRLTIPGTRSDGRLLIGDRALQWRRRFLEKGQVEGFSHMADLAELWYRQFGLPFVFARWVVRRDASPDVQRYLESWLKEFRSNEAELVRQAASGCGARLGMDKEQMQAYYNTLRRCLTEADLEGQKLFLAKLGGLDGWPGFEPCS